MIIYFAGNFPQIRTPDREQDMKEFVEGQGLEYNRLVSFYFPEDCKTIFQIKENSQCQLGNKS